MNYDYRIYTWPTRSIILADNKLAVSLKSMVKVILATWLRDDVITIKDSILIGQPSVFDCDAGNIVPWHARQYPDSRPPKHPKGWRSFCYFRIQFNWFFSYGLTSTYLIGEMKWVITISASNLRRSKLFYDFFLITLKRFILPFIITSTNER